MPARQRFRVELKDGDTTVVSWKKLVTDVEGRLGAGGAPSDAPAGANPALEARIAPEKGSGSGAVAGEEDALPEVPNRFSSVIERIERLYKGGDSDDENPEDSPDEDQYDTDDPFIDDEELNEYFMVEKAKTKHTGFFINRGPLEKINVAASPSPAVLPKKRKRREPREPREPKRVAGDKKVDDKETKRRIKGRLKAAARSFPHHTQAFGGGIELPREHGGSKPHSSEPEEISSDSDDYLQQQAGPLSMTHSQEKREFAAGKFQDKRNKGGLSIPSGTFDLHTADTNYIENVRWKSHVEVDNNGGMVERPLEASIAHASESIYDDVRISQNRSEYRNGSSVDERKWKEAAREPKGVMKVSKGVMKVSESLKMKMMQQSAKEEGTRDSDGGAGKVAAGYARPTSPGIKESSPGKRGWPKGTVMERAVQDLIKIVGSLCPSSAEGEDLEQPSQSGGKAKRLPREVKIRLAKVARLAQAKQGKVPDELVERLNGILGHIMRPNTLKRNLKEMVEHGLSAKQEKEGRLQDIKREVTEMVKSRVTSLQNQGVEMREGSADDLQAGQSEKASTSSEKYKWDHAMEDLLCNLYEQYLEGMDEHKGPQIRKLYVELAELWPVGWMDNNGIKAAVSRAKERKKRLNKLNKEPRRKSKAGSSSDRPRTEDEERGIPLNRFLNHPNQVFGQIFAKPRSPTMKGIRSEDINTPDDGFMLGGGQPAWAAGDSKVQKHKLLVEGEMRNPMKASKSELKEKMREGLEYIRDGVVVDKNALIKKRRKKVKAGIEVDLTSSPLLLGKSVGPTQDFLNNRVSKKLTLASELQDDGALRAAMRGPQLGEPLEKLHQPLLG